MERLPDLTRDETSWRREWQRYLPADYRRRTAVPIRFEREADLQAGAVNMDAWVGAGVTYVLRGALGSGSAQAELYDIASRRRVLGNSYSGFSQQQYRRLAHRVADDIMAAHDARWRTSSTQENLPFASASRTAFER